MAQKLYEETNIQSIADAIRAKNGSTDTYKTSEMAAAIAAITTGGGGIPEEALTLTGSCKYRFYQDSWTNWIHTYGQYVKTENLSDCSYMFGTSSTLTNIPFTLNLHPDFENTLTYMFQNCYALETAPRIVGKTDNFSYMFANCRGLRTADLTGIQFAINNISSGEARGGLFSGCYSLRSFTWNKPSFPYVTITSTSNSPYYQTFNNCYALDEITDFPVGCQGTSYHMKVSSCMNSFVYNCSRLKRLTFETTASGNPIDCYWGKLTLDLTTAGYTTNRANILNYNSGITADKEVTDDASYQALKNDPDWFTTNYSYSRYNHDSAVETINSLPNTVFYNSTSGGGNTIKFDSVAGLFTDGGAIENLTEEEIAVAAAKGWTVSLV